MSLFHHKKHKEENSQMNEKEKQKEYIDKLIKAYNEGKPLVDDATYDQILEDYLQKYGEEERPYLRAKQSSSVNDIVGTLTKVYGISTPMRKGQKTYLHDFVEKNSLQHERIVFQYKFDGCSVAFDFATEKFFTRGDYDNGESMDVTEIFESHLPKMYKLKEKMPDIKVAKFEFIMPMRVYEVYTKELEKPMRPRDMAAAAMKRRDKKMCAQCALIPLRLVNENNEVFVPRNIGKVLRALEIEEMNYSISACSEANFTTRIWYDDPESCDVFQVDGMVASVVMSQYEGPSFIPDVGYIPDEGYGSRWSEFYKIDPTKEVAIKIIHNILKTKLVDIQFEFGRSGRITPVGILEPVQYKDPATETEVTIDHVTLHNLGYVNNAKFRYNDTVSIMYNIVPYLVESEHDGDDIIPIPDTCPMCGCKLNYCGDDEFKLVSCENQNCRGKLVGRLARYCEMMGIMGVSDNTLSVFVEKDLIIDFPDLYTLTKEMIMRLNRFGEKSAENIVNSIQNNSKVTLARYLGAMIPMIGAKTWSKIIIKNEITADEFVDMSYEQFIERIFGNKVAGVGDRTTKYLTDAIKDYWDDIKGCNPFITFEPMDFSKKSKGVVTLTGYHDRQLIKDIIAAGYDVADWSNRTQFLIIKDENFMSMKVDAALKKGIPIITVENAYEALGIKKN